MSTGDNNDDVVSGELVPPEDFGVDNHDTIRGNGSYNHSIEELHEARDRHIAERKQAKNEAVQAFNEGMKAGLKQVAKFNLDLLQAGSDLAEKAAMGMILSQQERELLKMAANAAKEIADRGAGKAKTTHEEHKSVSILSVLLDARKEIEGGR